MKKTHKRFVCAQCDATVKSACNEPIFLDIFERYGRSNNEYSAISRRRKKFIDYVMMPYINSICAFKIFISRVRSSSSFLFLFLHFYAHMHTSDIHMVPYVCPLPLNYSQHLDL